MTSLIFELDTGRWSHRKGGDSNTVSWTWTNAIVEEKSANGELFERTRTSQARNHIQCPLWLDGLLPRWKSKTTGKHAEFLHSQDVSVWDLLRSPGGARSYLHWLVHFQNNLLLWLQLIVGRGLGVHCESSAEKTSHVVPAPLMRVERNNA